MNDIAFILNNTVIYWSQIVIVLAMLACLLLAFAFRPFTKVIPTAVIIWFILTWILGFFFSRLMFFYCRPEQLVEFKDLFTNILDNRHNVMGLILGAVVSALIVKFLNMVKKTGNLLDIAFPGIVLAVSLIRLSYIFSNTFHSNIVINTAIWKRFPFATEVTDTAGNSFYVFTPYMISFIVLLITAFVVPLIVRKKLSHPGDLFVITFTVFALSEMVLEGTRADSLKLHFSLLKFLNTYTGFISFTMFLCGICLIIIFIKYFAKLKPLVKTRQRNYYLILFILGFICFGLCEYFVQRYTRVESVFHWIQAGFALIMAIDIILVILNTNRQKEITDS